jgi:hypothetical protein
VDIFSCCPSEVKERISLLLVDNIGILKLLFLDKVILDQLLFEIPIFEFLFFIEFEVC